MSPGIYKSYDPEHPMVIEVVSVQNGYFSHYYLGDNPRKLWTAPITPYVKRWFFPVADYQEFFNAL